jgi:hypothetical protein
MPELIVQGRRVAYLDQGTGVPLVLLHADGSSGKQWPEASDSRLERTGGAGRSA